MWYPTWWRNDHSLWKKHTERQYNMTHQHHFYHASIAQLTLGTVLSFFGGFSNAHPYSQRTCLTYRWGYFSAEEKLRRPQKFLNVHQESLLYTHTRPHQECQVSNTEIALHGHLRHYQIQYWLSKILYMKMKLRNIPYWFPQIDKESIRSKTDILWLYDFQFTFTFPVLRNLPFSKYIRQPQKPS